MTCASFDVFDTCLTRTVCAPSEVFRLLGLQIGTKAGVVAPEAFARQFVAWRIEAERRARLHANSEEVTLEQIWIEMRGLLEVSGMALPDGPQLEMKAESDMLVGVAQVREQVASARASGKRVLFISDTYLPAVFVRRLLRRHCFAEPADHVYVSSETGLTKHTGNLFRHVIATENIPAAELHHIGDNPAADVFVPRSIGVRTTHFGAGALTGSERLLLTHLSNVTAGPRTAGRLRAARLSLANPVPSRPGIVELVNEFLGPLLAVLGRWVIRRARADGMVRLYFASRDARLLWTVCRCVVAEIDCPIDCRYLHISRRALLLASSSEVSPRDLAWLQRDFEVPSLPRLLGKLEIPFELFLPTWHRIQPAWGEEQPLATPEHWQAFWRELEKPEVHDALMETIIRKRSTANAYLGQAGLFDTAPAGFVDLGWFLSCQAALNRLRAGSGQTPLRGYFLALLQGRLGPGEAGPACALFEQAAADLPQPVSQRWLRRNHLLEHVAGIAEHASVTGYSAEGQPLFSHTEGTAHLALFAAVEGALLRYEATKGRHWSPIADDDEAAQAFLSALLDNFFDHPPAQVVAELAGVMSDSDQTRHDTEELARPYSWAEVLAAWLPGNGVAALDHRIWPEASSVVTPRFRRAIHRRSAAVQHVYHRLGLT